MKRIQWFFVQRVQTTPVSLSCTSLSLWHSLHSVCPCAVADSEGGGLGGPGPPSGMPKNVKGPHYSETTEKFCYYPPPTESRRVYPPPTESRRVSETTEKFCYYPPPTESRRLGTSHERGRLLRKILDLRLVHDVIISHLVSCFFTWELGIGTVSIHIPYSKLCRLLWLLACLSQRPLTQVPSSFLCFHYLSPA